MKYFKLFEDYTKLNIGDNTTIGKIDDMTDDQFFIDGNWYAKRIIKPTDSVTDNVTDTDNERTPLYIDKDGKNIVFDNGDGILIVVDDVNNAHYISLWDMKKESRRKVGFLIITKSKMSFKGEEYNTLDSVEIDKEYRGKGYGHKLYEIALKYLNNNVKGIVSYLPDRVNKNQVPAIYRKFDNEIIDNTYHIINR